MKYSKVLRYTITIQHAIHCALILSSWLLVSKQETWEDMKTAENMHYFFRNVVNICATFLQQCSGENLYNIRSEIAVLTNI